jgi:hypothetical protein
MRPAEIEHPTLWTVQNVTCSSPTKCAPKQVRTHFYGLWFFASSHSATRTFSWQNGARTLSSENCGRFSLAQPNDHILPCLASYFPKQAPLTRQTQNQQLTGRYHSRSRTIAASRFLSFPIKDKCLPHLFKRQAAAIAKKTDEKKATLPGHRHI